MPTRQKQQTEILWGVHSVREALRAGRRRIHEILISGDKTAKRLPEITDQARTKNISVRMTSPDELKKLTGAERHQGVAAIVTPLPLVEFSTLLDKAAALAQSPFYLLVDSVEDPHNLGALVRTAVCAGITGIIIPRDRSASPTPAVSRTSAGALEHAVLCRVTNLVNAMKDLKKVGIWIIGLDREGKSSIYETDMTGPRALVIGGEDTGVRRLVAEQCDFMCHIPQTGLIDSLNASVAGAVTMYEAFRQRQQA